MIAPRKVVLVYDGDCGFCRLWIARWKRITGGRVDYAPYQEAGERFPEISPERFARSIQLIEPAGTVTEGAEAAFRALAYNPSWRGPLWAYNHIPGVRAAAEGVYRWVARSRTGLSKVARGLWGESPDPPAYFLTRGLFLRCLGAVYCAAFLSLAAQILGLAGSHGILSAEAFLEGAGQPVGVEKYLRYPTLFWLHISDGFLEFLCFAGAALALALVMGVSPAVLLFALWLFYLSIVTVCREFMWYQWDSLLLETGFLAIFLAPSLLRPGGKPGPPSRAVWFLLRLLLFKVMFFSGVVKLTSGDPAWSGLTALYYHYETQPLPTWIGWYAHHLPPLFQKASVAAVFFVELAVPFFIFAPRRVRALGCGLIAGFQVLILLTGNYGFFNLLVLALCLPLLDDAFLRRFSGGKTTAAGPPSRGWRRVFAKTAYGGLAAALLSINAVHVSALFGGGLHSTAPAQAALNWLRPFHVADHYGLFAVMTTTRPEIIVEGSNDLNTWLEYEFKWKPGKLDRAPSFNIPHQPRLDWQMWFAALNDYRNSLWLIHFLSRLLEGSPEVLSLLEGNPFPDAPPQYIRAVLYDYRFTERSFQNGKGQWWRRERVGLYSPVLRRLDVLQTMERCGDSRPCREGGLEEASIPQPKSYKDHDRGDQTAKDVDV